MAVQNVNLTRSVWLPLKVGIQPDVPLGPDAMPPADGPGFCKFVASADAPPLFGPVRSGAPATADLVGSSR